MTIRPATAADAEAVAIVQVRSWQAAYRGLMPQDFLDGLDVDRRRRGWERIITEADWPSRGTFVAETGDGVVGFATFSAAPAEDADPAPVGQLNAIYLLPAAWSTGLGRQLITRTVAALVEAGYREARLWVLDTNDRARRFYAAAGWQPDGVSRVDTDFGIPLQEVRYHRPLP